MLDTLDAVGRAGADPGAVSLSLGRGRENQARDRAEAIRKGRMVEDPQKLEARIRGVAEDFVSVFMAQVMKSMRATVPENPAMHGDNGEKFFQEMLDSEQAKTLAGGQGYGLTELVYQSLLNSHRVQSSAGAGLAAEELSEAPAAGAPEELP